MHKYAIRRVLQAIPIIFGITVITFLLAQAMPGDPVSGIISPRVRGSDLERMRELRGLNDPIYVQYFKWLQATAAGNFGVSFQYNNEVSEVIAQRIWPTLALGLLSLFIGLGLGVPLGIVSAVRQYSFLDNVLTVVAFSGVSAPTFFTGLLAIYGFSIKARWFPTSGLVTPGASFPFPQNYLDVLHHLVLPAAVLGFFSVAGLMRYVRASMLEVLRHDYVRTARAKGLGERVVVYKHALRNALIPVVTILGLSLPGLVSGAIITEQVFTIPGMGRLSYLAVLQRDYPIIMATTLLFAVLTVVGNLLADLAYAWVDPRIRYD